MKQPVMSIPLGRVQGSGRGVRGGVKGGGGGR